MKWLSGILPIEPMSLSRGALWQIVSRVCNFAPDEREQVLSMVGENARTPVVLRLGALESDLDQELSFTSSLDERLKQHRQRQTWEVPRWQLNRSSIWRTWATWSC